jgi:hypothetical protein
VIFGLADYALYRLRKRRYSSRRLEAQGFAQATAVNFPRRVWPPAGCVIALHTAGSFISWVIMYVTNGPVSHVASSIGSGSVVDVSFNGVEKYPFLQLLDGRSFISIKSLPLTDEGRVRFAETMEDSVGRITGYNWWATAYVGAREVLGRADRTNYRLYVDVLICICVAGFPFGSLSGWPNWWLLIPCGLYSAYIAVGVWARHHLQRRGLWQLALSNRLRIRTPDQVWRRPVPPWL